MGNANESTNRSKMKKKKISFIVNKSLQLMNRKDYLEGLEKKITTSLKELFRRGCYFEKSFFLRNEILVY